MPSPAVRRRRRVRAALAPRVGCHEVLRTQAQQPCASAASAGMAAPQPRSSGAQALTPRAASNLDSLPLLRSLPTPLPLPLYSSSRLPVPHSAQNTFPCARWRPPVFYSPSGARRPNRPLPSDLRMNAPRPLSCRVMRMPQPLSPTLSPCCLSAPTRSNALSCHTSAIFSTVPQAAPACNLAPGGPPFFFACAVDTPFQRARLVRFATRRMPGGGSMRHQPELEAVVMRHGCINQV